MAARAKALAKRAREQGKNLAKAKGLRRVVDSVLSNSEMMSIIPSGSAISGGYKSIKGSVREASRVVNSVRSLVSPCTKKWFTALTSPFSQEAQGACIPAGTNTASMRYMNYIRGDIVVGTNGIGYLQLIPTAYNDVVSAVVTDATFTGINSKVFTAGGANPWLTGVAPVYFTNGRFSSAQATAPSANQAVTSRLVGGGLKLYYTGTELNLGGLVSIYTSPMHSSANSVQNTSVGNPYTPFTPSLLGGYQETLIRPITRNAFEYPLSPLLDAELSYSPNYNDAVSSTDYIQTTIYPWSASGYLYNSLSSTSNQGNANVFLGLPTTIVMVTGSPGNTIHFEYAIHVESVGDLTEGMRAPADSDSVGVDALMAALSRVQISRNSYPNDSAATVLRREMSLVQAARDKRVAL